MKELFPYSEEFVEYLMVEPKKDGSSRSKGSVNCYKSYVNKVINTFDELQGTNLRENIFAYLADPENNNLDLDKVRTYVKLQGILDPKYISGFYAYQLYLEGIVSGDIDESFEPEIIKESSPEEKIEVNTVETKEKEEVPALDKMNAFLNENTNVSFTQDELLKKFVFRMNTQNRFGSNKSCYFPASLLNSLDKEFSSQCGKQMLFHKFLEKECMSVIFLCKKDDKIIPLKLADIDSLTFDGVVWTVRDKNNSYTLYTENPNVKNGEISYNGHVCEIMPACNIKKLVIDHDPEIARTMDYTVSKGWIPSLCKLREYIDTALSKGLNYVYKNKKQEMLPKQADSNQKIAKKQLRAVVNYWRSNNCIPEIKNLMKDIEYLHSTTTLTIMYDTYNLNKNGVAKVDIIMSPPSEKGL